MLAKLKHLIDYKLPELMSTADGKKYTISDNILWTAYPMIKGKIVCSWQDAHKADDAAGERLMKALRHIHDSTKGKFKENDLDYFLGDIKRKLEDVKDMLSDDVIKRINIALNKIASKKYSTSELCFVHGDYHHGNALVDEKGDIIALLDLDWSRISHPLEDLAFSFNMLLRDYRDKKFKFPEKLFYNLLLWYGLEEKQLFYEYLILNVLFDLYIFKHEIIGKSWLEYQLTFLEDVCEKF